MARTQIEYSADLVGRLTGTRVSFVRCYKGNARGSLTEVSGIVRSDSVGGQLVLRDTLITRSGETNPGGTKTFQTYEIVPGTFMAEVG
jgi:hypothetical protein